MEKCSNCDIELKDDVKCNCDSKLCKECCDCEGDSKCACGHDCGCGH